MMKTWKFLKISNPRRPQDFSKNQASWALPKEEEADIFVEDKLFATLDTCTKQFTLPNNQKILSIISFMKTFIYQRKTRKGFGENQS